MKKKLLALAMLVFLVGGIFEVMRLEEEYEVIVITGTMDSSVLDVAGYIDSGFLETKREDTSFRRSPCPVCEAIQRGEITLTSWLEESDNFTVIMKEGAYELQEPVFQFYPSNTHNIEVEIKTSEE